MGIRCYLYIRGLIGNYILPFMSLEKRLSFVIKSGVLFLQGKKSIICTLINIFFFSRLQPVLQLRECYWFGIDFGVICCHLTKNSFTKLFDIRTAGNVTFVNVFNHIFNKTADAHHKNHFPLPSKCVKSANLLLQLELNLLNKGTDLKTDNPLRNAL